MAYSRLILQIDVDQLSKQDRWHTQLTSRMHGNYTEAEKKIICVNNNNFVYIILGKFHHKKCVCKTDCYVII